MNNPYVDRVKVYRVLAYMRIDLPDGTDYWESPEETTIIPSAVTSIVDVNTDYAIIKYAGQVYKIYREDFDKMFEVEVL